MSFQDGILRIFVSYLVVGLLYQIVLIEDRVVIIRLGIDIYFSYGFIVFVCFVFVSIIFYRFKECEILYSIVLDSWKSYDDRCMILGYLII